MQLSSSESTRKTVFLSLLAAMGGALHIVESVVTIAIPLPGIKLGLANIVTLIAIRIYGARAGFMVAILRVTLGSLIGGLFLSPTYLIAVSGALLSTVFMSFVVKKTTCFSNIGVSVIGSIAHNIGQLAAASFILQTTATIYYLPPLLFAAIASGVATGYIVNIFLDNREIQETIKKFVSRSTISL